MGYFAFRRLQEQRAAASAAAPFSADEPKIKENKPKTTKRRRVSKLRESDGNLT